MAHATTTADRFERLARELGPAISRVARGYARTTAEREDLEQDIALAVWRALATFRGDCSERTFVLRIAHNQALTFLTRRRARPDAEELDETLRTDAPDPEVLAGLSERLRRVVTALHRLPLGQRQVLLLALEGLSHDEIAQVLGISVGNVAVRVSRARADLKQTLEPEAS
jgi:RNA polymerase sigma-70 factor (ECF subfamily)